MAAPMLIPAEIPIEYLTRMTVTKIPPKLEPWFEARKRYRLTDRQIQMARELGLNPKKFGSLANRQETWKVPLPQFIERCYQKQFKMERPIIVLSLEEVIARELAKKQKKQASKERTAESTQVSPTPLNSDGAASLT
jgi:hypothetical protein